MASDINELILQEILITIETLDKAIFSNCIFAPVLGGSTIITSNLFNSMCVKGLFLRLRENASILLLKPCSLAAKLIAFMESILISYAVTW